MTQYAYMTYHRKDDNILETCVNSLHLVNPSAQVVITTDGVPDELDKRMTREYGVQWIRVPTQKMYKRRATCKIEFLNNLIQQCNDGDEILVSDVDVYFIKDPFVAFIECMNMDLGLTTRGYKHLFPINGGIFYIRVNSKMKAWVDWHVKEIHHPLWPPYTKAKRVLNHYSQGLDWTVGQDFLIACWGAKDELLKTKGIDVIDVGSKYNYCPATDLNKPQAFNMAWNALNEKSVVTLHLKSELKQMVYDGKFPNAKLNYPKGQLAWK